MGIVWIFKFQIGSVQVIMRNPHRHYTLNETEEKNVSDACNFKVVFMAFISYYNRGLGFGRPCCFVHVMLPLSSTLHDPMTVNNDMVIKGCEHSSRLLGRDPPMHQP